MKKEEFLKKIETELKISKNSEHTITNYLAPNQSLLEFSGKEPEQITQDDVKLFMAEKLSERASSSIILFLSAIKYAYTNILKKDITLTIKRPKKEKKIPSVLTKDEVKKLINSADTKKSKLMISMLYACGFRVSELTNLKIKDLNFEEKIGYVKQGKGRKDRMFNIPNFLLEDLKSFSEMQKQSGQEFLFSGPKGRLSSRNLQKIVSKLSFKAGINKPVHPHTLRHCYATHLLEDGVDIRMIQVLLGHSNLSTTEIYTHVSAEQLKKISSPIDSLMIEKENKENKKA